MGSDDGKASAVANAEVAREISAAGFEAYGTCAAGELRVRPEVRDMCSSGNCRAFGKNWACPPVCGELAEFQCRIDDRATCHVVQTVRRLRREFDGKTMMEAERVQKQRLSEVADRLRDDGVDALVLAAGTCTVCEKCAYPDPCRFPEKRLSSMEAAGLLVSDVCNSAGVPYNHGRLTIAYTSCILV